MRWTRRHLDKESSSSTSNAKVICARGQLDPSRSRARMLVRCFARQAHRMSTSRRSRDNLSLLTFTPGEEGGAPEGSIASAWVSLLPSDQGASMRLESPTERGRIEKVVEQAGPRVSERIRCGFAHDRALGSEIDRTRQCDHHVGLSAALLDFLQSPCRGASSSRQPTPPPPAIRRYMSCALPSVMRARKANSKPSRRCFKRREEARRDGEFEAIGERLRTRRPSFEAHAPRL